MHRRLDWSWIVVGKTSAYFVLSFLLFFPPAKLTFLTFADDDGVTRACPQQRGED